MTSPKLYTGGGDRGETRLWDGSRVSKLDPRIELNGILDEVGSAVGLARSLAPEPLREELLRIQKLLQDLMAYVARGHKEVAPPNPEPLESWMDRILADYPMEPKFVFPGDSPAGGALHLARTVARRAERAALPLWDGGGMIHAEAYRFINRLSDLLFALARKADVESRVASIVRRVLSDSGGNGERNERASARSGAIVLEEALPLIAAAKAEAVRAGVPVVIAVCDAEGSLVAFQRMDGALPVSVRLAADKAATAVKLRMDTDSLAPLVQPGAPLYGLQNDPALVVFGGGKLLVREGAVAGAVGVSGGSVEEDMRVADAALRRFAELMAVLQD